MQSHFDAIIVGAGPAGASAAILLANAGWSVALIEKQSFPRRKVCGECVAASNLPLLDALGVGSDFTAQAGPELRQVAFMRGARTVYAELPAATHPKHAWGRALGRETLDALLLERAREAGAVVMQPYTVQDLRGASGRHECTLRKAGSPQQMVLNAPVAILAHGSWEPLPAARMQQRHKHRAGDLLAFKANFHGANLPAGLLCVLAFEGGYGGIVLGDDGLVTLACCIRVDRLDALRRAAPGVSAGDAVEAMLKRECAGVAEALQAATRADSWLASGPLAPGVRLQSSDAVFRIGNAAGEAHPIIGEGMSMAMQSAWLLCAHLIRARPNLLGQQVGGQQAGGQPAGGGDDPAWQDAVHAQYAREWRRHFAPRLRLAAAFSHLAMRPLTSRALFGLLSLWPALLTTGAAWGGKVRCAVEVGTISKLSAKPAMAFRRPISAAPAVPQRI